MILEIATALALAQRCAPSVAPATLLPMIAVESQFDTLAIGVNRGPPLSRRPRTTAEAVLEASRRVTAGEDVDLGLAQINSRNLARLGLTVEAAFDPCRNLAAAARLATASYRLARRSAPDEQAALRTMLSLYNTGHPERGFRRGYVAKVEAAARGLAPMTPSLRAAPVARASEQQASTSNVAVFARSPTSSVMVFGPVGGGAELGDAP